MGYLVARKNFFVALIICLLQIIITSIGIVGYLLTNNILPIIIIPIIEIALLILLNKSFHCFRIKTYLFAGLIMLLIFLFVTLYMFVNKSVLGFCLAIFIYIFGFVISDILCVIILKYNKDT